MLELHGRQFVLGPGDVRAGPDWITSTIAGTGRLSRSPRLPASSVVDRDGVEWCLLGAAWADPPPCEQLRGARTSEVPGLSRGWAGRWVLLGAGRVHQDAASLLGCFYRDGWVSSSASLLARGDAPVARAIRHAVGMDWLPPPGSRFSSVRRLLPSQVLRVADGAISPRPLVEPRPALGYEAVLDRLERCLIDGVRAAAREGPLHVPLTAGRDSRLILAATRAAGLSARTFTQGYSGIGRGDRELPPLLARAIGREHSWIEPGDRDVSRERLYDEHTSGHCVDADRDFVARGQWDWCGPGDVVLRGGAFEIGRCGFYHELGDGPFSAATILAEYPTHDRGSLAAIDEWLAWCARHPEPMDWRDRFYWEQRVAGWLGAVEQSLDLLPGTRAHVANSHRFFELALSLPVEVRFSGRHHEDLIARMAPELARFPYNPHDPWPVRYGRKVARRVRKWWWQLAAS